MSYGGPLYRYVLLRGILSPIGCSIVLFFASSTHISYRLQRHALRA
jgi:hypothetical protein